MGDQGGRQVERSPWAAQVLLREGEMLKITVEHISTDESERTEWVLSVVLAEGTLIQLIDALEGDSSQSLINLRRELCQATGLVQA